MRVLLIVAIAIFISGCTVREIVQPKGPSSYEQNQKAQKAWQEIK